MPSAGVTKKGKSKFFRRFKKRSTKGNLGFSTSSAVTRYPDAPWTSMTSLSRGLVFPSTMRTKVKTSWCGYLGVAAVTPTAFSINCASFYRPFNVPSQGVASSAWTNGVGFDQNEQPVGYQTLVNIYNRYRVLGCKIKVKCTLNSSADTSNLTVWSGPDTVLTTLMPPDQYMNCAFSQSKMVSFGADPVEINDYRRIEDILGMSRINYEGQGSISVTAQPNVPAYYNIGFNTIAGGILSGNVWIEIELQQYVELSGQSMQTQ